MQVFSGAYTSFFTLTRPRDRVTYPSVIKVSHTQAQSGPKYPSEQAAKRRTKMLVLSCAYTFFLTFTRLRDRVTYSSIITVTYTSTVWTVISIWAGQKKKEQKCWYFHVPIHSISLSQDPVIGSHIPLLSQSHTQAQSGPKYPSGQAGKSRIQLKIV